MFFPKGNKGFSTVEILVMASMGAVISAAIFQMSIRQIQSMVYIEDKMASLDFKSMITGYLLDEDSCRNTLQGTPSNSSSKISGIKGPKNKTLFSQIVPNNKFGPHLDIFQMQLIPIVGQQVGANSLGVMNIVIEMHRRRGNGFKEQLFSEVPLRVQTDAAGNISSCISLGGTLSAPPAPGGTANPTTPGGTTNQTAQPSGGNCQESMVRFLSNCKRNLRQGAPFCSNPRAGSLQQCRNGRWVGLYSFR